MYSMGCLALNLSPMKKYGCKTTPSSKQKELFAETIVSETVPRYRIFTII